MKKSDLPLVSIIIVNFNGKLYLEKCLESLLKINYSTYEIIIIDNNSTDDSILFLNENYPQIIIKKLEKNYGFAYPNNLGAKMAKGKFLLFLNNDTIVTSTFLNPLVEVLTNNPLIAVTQAALLKPNHEIDSYGDFLDSNILPFNSKKKTSEISDILGARGACMLIRKNIFNKLHGFDEKFFLSFEDVDLCWRSWILGYRSVIVPNSIVYHLVGQTIKKRNDMAFHSMKNQLVMRITNLNFIDSLKSTTKFIIVFGIKTILSWFEYKIYGKTKVAISNHNSTLINKPDFLQFAKGFFWVIKNWSYISKKKRRISKNKILSIKKLKTMNLIKN